MADTKTSSPAQTYDGLALTGQFLQTKAVTRKDGTPVQGLYEIHVQCGRRTMRATFNETDELGDRHKVIQALDAESPAGRRVCVPVTVRAQKGDQGYVNYSALALYVFPHEG